MQTALITLAAYLLGSVSFAVLVSRLMRLPDPRSYGSGNPGATNVLRSGSRAAAALTLLGDTGKGALAVGLAALYTGQGTVAGVDPPIAGAMALFGHAYPAFHGFRGGKGVATAAGVLLALSPWLGLAALATFGVIVAFMLAFAGSDLAYGGSILEPPAPSSKDAHAAVQSVIRRIFGGDFIHWL